MKGKSLCQSAPERQEKQQDPLDLSIAQEGCRHGTPSAPLSASTIFL